MGKIRYDKLPFKELESFRLEIETSIEEII